MPSLFADDFVPPPRVRAEGQTIYKQHQGTIQNVMLEVEGRSLFDRSASAYKKPKDHMLENVRRVRQIQKACRARVKESEEKDPEPVKGLWRSSKYAAVPSKVAQFRVNSTMPKRPASARPASVHPLSKAESTKENFESHGNKLRRPQSARPATSQRPEIVPPLNDIEDDSSITVKKTPRNVIRDNAIAAIHAPMRRSPSAMSLKEAQQRNEDRFRQKYQPGYIPEYLKQRQRQWKTEEEERIKNLPDPEQPPGHRILPNEERHATLEKLRLREKELTNELLRMPLMVDTPRMIKQKNDIESQLSEVDEAIRIFSRRKVFVKCE